MTDINSNNDDLSKLMKKAILKMPFNDFEETLMKIIGKETEDNTVLTRDRKLSLFFFLVGTGFGLTINSILEKTQFSFLNISSGTMRLVFQAGLVLVFLLQLEKNLPFIGKWTRQKP